MNMQANGSTRPRKMAWWISFIVISTARGTSDQCHRLQRGHRQRPEMTQAPTSAK